MNSTPILQMELLLGDNQLLMYLKKVNYVFVRQLKVKWHH